jgi:Tfp pilus assembly protein PilO
MPFPGENPMSKLSKEKKNQLVLVCLVIAAVMVGIWFGLISTQSNSLRELAEKKQAAERKLDLVETAVKNADGIEAQVAEATDRLAELESRMASGDLFSWIHNTIREFKAPHTGVDIPSFSRPAEAQTTLLPKFPYRQVTVAIGGTAFYHDLGRFVADFENTFPHMRIQNIDLDPVPTGSSDSEKLQFKMDLVALIKPEA